MISVGTSFLFLVFQIVRGMNLGNKSPVHIFLDTIVLEHKKKDPKLLLCRQPLNQPPLHCHVGEDPGLVFHGLLDRPELP